MRPIAWRDDLKTYGGEAAGQPEYYPLPVLDAVTPDGQECKLSAWKPDFMDWLRLLFGGPVYLLIQGGQPPVVVSTERLDV